MGSIVLVSFYAASANGNCGTETTLFHAYRLFIYCTPMVDFHALLCLISSMAISSVRIDERSSASGL